MECYKIENLSFAYPGQSNAVLNNINLTVNKGEFITICGKSGCGKSTLLRLLNPSLAPFGTMSGNIYFEGLPVSEISERTSASKIGFVMQNPDNAIVTDKVWHELAFGLESLGISNSEIRTRTAETASFFGIQDLFHKKTDELSGGQKQLVNLASAVAMRPHVLILDEPTSRLDPISAQNFINTLEKINTELGTAIILCEHRLDGVISLSDRLIVMENGRIVSDAHPSETPKLLKKQNCDMISALPSPMQIYGSIINGENYPLTVCGAKKALEEYAEKFPPNFSPAPKKVISSAENSAVKLHSVWFRYSKNAPDIIKGLDLNIGFGEIFAIIGGNGVGKSTALSVISGINTPYRGRVLIKGKKFSKTEDICGKTLGVLPQNPQTLFVKNTVYLDLADMLKDIKISEDEKKQKILETACLCRIDHLLERHPYDLSGGEQQMTAFAKILLLNPEIILLDEPTKGMDFYCKAIFAEIIKKLSSSGKAVVMVSHDIEFCAEYADRCAMLFDGTAASIGTPSEIFSKNSFYTTSAHRIAGEILPDAILAGEVIRSFGKNSQHASSPPPSAPQFFTHTVSETEIGGIKNDTRRAQKHKKNGIIYFSAAVLILLTFIFGVRFFGGRKYYLTSILIIAEAMLPFFAVFEKRMPKAREIVTLSVMCAIAVAGRAAFFMLPQFKPTAAVIIISGICLGAESGFLIGSVSAFVSNFFFGQGPWTPWQMLAFGIIGLVSGLLFRPGILPKKRLEMCCFGAVSVLLIYGAIMNLSTVIIYNPNPTLKAVISVFVSGFPFDAIHALSTVVFLFFLSEPFIEKLERIKKKYGFLK